MPDYHKNLWAPWRMAYIRTLAEESDEGCFLCQYRAASNDDAAHHVIRRTGGMMVLLNRFPYSNGHLMIAPLAHKAKLADLCAAEMSDCMRLMVESQDALRACVHAQGFNLGMNVGTCAGAGVPDHLHWHVVPRWGGDTY
ncbi:MAG: DUF4922 domain-containing protein, partial [Phycisphaerae bacterium]